jgi:hypothetical protein
MQGILALLNQAFGLLLTVPAPLDPPNPFADHPPGVPGRHIPSARLLHAPQALKMQKSVQYHGALFTYQLLLGNNYISMWTIRLSPKCLYFDSYVNECICVL